MKLLVFPLILVLLMAMGEWNLRRRRRALAALVVGEPTFRESWAGGYRYDHPVFWWVVFRNCLRLSVAGEHLRVAPWRPFAWVGVPIGMELAIPLAAITGVTRHHQLGTAVVLIRWANGAGEPNCIAIRSHNEKALLAALGQTLAEPAR